MLDGRHFEWVEHDITRSAELYEEYRYDIPVVVVDGREVARLHVDPTELARLLGL